jgi:hypothetical protein
MPTYFADTFNALTGTSVVASDLSSLQSISGEGDNFHLVRSATLGGVFTFQGVSGIQLTRVDVRYQYSRTAPANLLVEIKNTSTGQWVTIATIDAGLFTVFLDTVGVSNNAIDNGVVELRFRQEDANATIGDFLKLIYLSIETSLAGVDPFRAGGQNITSTGGPPTETNDYTATHAKGEGLYHQVNIGSDTVNIHYLFPVAIPARLEWVHFCYYFTSSPDGGQILVEGWNADKDAWELLGPRLDEAIADTTAQYGLFDGWNQDEGSGLVRFTSLQPAAESITWRLDDLFVSGRAIGAVSAIFIPPGSGEVNAPTTSTGDYTNVGTRDDVFHILTGDGTGNIDARYTFNIGQTLQADGTFKKNTLEQIAMVFDSNDTTSLADFAGLQAYNYTSAAWDDIEKPFPVYAGFQTRRWGQQPSDYVDTGGDVQLRLFGKLENLATFRVDQLVVLAGAPVSGGGGDGDGGGGETGDCDLTHILGQPVTEATVGVLANAFSEFFSKVSFTGGKLNVNADCIAGAVIDPNAGQNFNTYFINSSTPITTQRVGFIDQPLSAVGGSGEADLSQVIAKLGPFTSTADTPTDSNVYDWMRAIMRADLTVPADIGGTYDPGNHSMESLVARGGPGPWTTADISGNAIASSQSLTLLDNATLSGVNLPTTPTIYNSAPSAKDQQVVIDVDVSNLDNTAIDSLDLTITMDGVSIEGLDPLQASVQSAETTQHLQIEMTYRAGRTLLITLFSTNANSTAADIQITIWRLGGDSVNIGAIDGTPITEVNVGDISRNWANFYDNGDVIAGVTLSSVADPLNQSLAEVVPPVALGSDYTGAQLLYAIRAGILDHELDGALKRLFKTDTVTVNSTYDLDSAQSPTLIKRAT